jgi:hypothetical protein
VINEDEARMLAEIRDLTARVIAVDHFDPADVSHRQPAERGAPASFAPPKDPIAAE